MTVMASMLRRHGATLTERHGRPVAAHFGSPTAEAAVCRLRVGLAERSDRATLEVRGPRAEVERALAEIATVGGGVAGVRTGAGRALVRCDGGDEGRCVSAVRRAPDVSVCDVSLDFAAIELVGPHAEEALRAAAVEEEDRVVVLREGGGRLELLVPRTHGPALWNRLLEAGEPLGIACVGVDALEHLAASDHAGRPRDRAAVD